MARAGRSRLREWLPVIVGLAIVMLVVAGVFGAVSAQRPTIDRALDVAVFDPPLRGRQPDTISGELLREAGCTYLVTADERRWVVMVPDLGSRWEQGALWIASNRYPLGSTVHLRGLIVKLPVAGFDVDVPEGCRGATLFFMVRV